ncbi:MAG: hypothetical protein AB7I19_18510 [Planctomycetota bacterium]
MTPPAPSPADIDYAAAMHEFDSNVGVRRLMLVLTNVLTPAMVMAVGDCLTGASPLEALAWLPRMIVPFTAALLLLAGVLVTGIVVRCHFGLVINGTKLKKVEKGVLVLGRLNWLGVTTNFVVLTAMTAALGAMGLAVGLQQPAYVVGGGGGTVAVALFAWLWLTHQKANRRCKQLDVDWQAGPPSTTLRAEHARKSLEAAAADISVVVVMAVALFAGFFNAIANLGAVPLDLAVVPTPESIHRHGAFVLLVFLLISMLLSLRILLRLRLAFGEFSIELAELRKESDDTAMKWKLVERTYLLYAIVLLLVVASAFMLGYERRDLDLGLLLGGVTAVGGAAWYPLTLARERRRKSKRAA